MNRCETLIPLFEVSVVTGRTNTGNVKVSDVCYDHEIFEHFGQALVFCTKITHFIVRVASGIE